MKKTFKEYLRPNNGVYSEGPMSLIMHQGILYKLDVIFEYTIDLPVTMLSVDDLRWQVENIKGEADRMKKADTKVPIIVHPQNGKNIVLDGTHRLLKAIKNGDKQIPARVIFEDVLAIARLGSGSDVAFASAVQDQNAYLDEARRPAVAIRRREATGGGKGRYDDQEEWEEFYPSDIGSAFEMWMDDTKKNTMFNLYRKGADFTAKDFNGSDKKVEEKIKKWIDSQLAKGFKQYAREDNYDSIDVILVKNMPAPSGPTSKKAKLQKRWPNGFKTV